MSGRKQPTMRDVAERAGVSVSTVSNYVNGRTNLMRDPTRDRVEEAMVFLDYRPNATARGLRSSRVREIGFLIVDDAAKFLADPMNGQVMAGAGEVTSERDYGLLIESAKLGEIDDGLFRPIRENRIDGGILFLSGAPRQRDVYLNRAVELGFPYVLFGESRNAEVASVSADNRSGAYELTQHLLEHGHERIAFIAGEASWPMIEQRHVGYRDALRANDVEPLRELQLFRGRYEPAAGEAMTGALLELKEPPTAIVTANDVLALGVYREARKRGLVIPDDLAVTGFDDLEFASCLDPPLSTVSLPMHEMGRAAGSMVLDQLETSEPARQEEFPVAVRIRQSSCRCGEAVDSFQDLRGSPT